MAELSRSSKYRATPDAPLPEQERERIVQRLNEAYESGAVDADAYPTLLDTAFGATTLGDVAPVVEAIPGEVTYQVPAVVESGTQPPGQLTQAKQPSTVAVAAVIGVTLVTLVILAAVLGWVLF